MSNNVKKLAVSNMTIFQSVTLKVNNCSVCTVATNLVKSLESNPIRCAITLCHFGRTRNGYVGTRFILLSSASESCATSGSVVVSERLSQNEEPAASNKERATKKPSSVPKVDLIDAVVFLNM